jgi:XTP/dITP diphosphohydrolase
VTVRYPRLVVATTNPGKLREIFALLDGVANPLLTVADWPAIEAPEETGATFSENARLKALHYGAATGLPTVAEDSGLEIDALGGAPGVESARFGGVQSSYPEKFQLIYARLGSEPKNTAARFVCALAVADRGRIVFEASGTIDGTIAAVPSGTGGFGYDPIFYYPPFGCTLAQAPDRKAEVSHRAVAFGKLKAHLLAAQPE